MKRTIILSLVLVLSFLGMTTIAQAQINRNIFNLQLGKSTESQVKNVLKSKGYKYKIMPDGSIGVITVLKYGGGLWNYVNFKCHKGILFDVYFQSNDYDAPVNINVMHETISTSLNKKYKQYKDKDISSSETEYFFDGKTWIIFGVEYSDNQEYIHLRYYDKKLNDKYEQSMEDEL